MSTYTISKEFYEFACEQLNQRAITLSYLESVITASFMIEREEITNWMQECKQTLYHLRKHECETRKIPSFYSLYKKFKNMRRAMVEEKKEMERRY